MDEIKIENEQLQAELAAAREACEELEKRECVGCGTVHPLKSECPPHECTITGMNALRDRIELAVKMRTTPLEVALAAARDNVRLLQTELAAAREALAERSTNTVYDGNAWGKSEVEDAAHKLERAKRLFWGRNGKDGE